MPDAVGNLFRTQDRSDRKYGPAGQLLEARQDDGSITRYEYDAEGNLIRKLQTDPCGAEVSVWTYVWNGAGMLTEIIRPDGQIVRFSYDSLGRRLSKTFATHRTRWIWDGNVPLHEWVEVISTELPSSAGTAPIDETVLAALAARRRWAALAARPAQGPPLWAAAEIALL